MPSEALVEQFYSLAKFIYDNMQHKLSQENVNCITMKHLSYRLKESDKRAVRTCGNFIFGKPRPNLSPFFPTRFLSSLWIHLLIRFSFFLQDLFQSLFKIFINLFNVSCKFFQGFSKCWSSKYSKLSIFSEFFLKLKVKLILKIEVRVGSRYQKI